MNCRSSLSILLVGFAVFAAFTIMSTDRALAACNDPPGPGVDWRQCNFDRYELEKIDLSGARLDNASFNRASMIGTNFSKLQGGQVRFIGANLQQTIFDEAELRNADFSQANLSGASFKGADLANARLVSANLRGANLTASRLRGADFFRADLSGAIWLDGKRVCAEGSISFCR